MDSVHAQILTASQLARQLLVALTLVAHKLSANFLLPVIGVGTMADPPSPPSWLDMGTTALSLSLPPSFILELLPSVRNMVREEIRVTRDNLGVLPPSSELSHSVSDLTITQTHLVSLYSISTMVS